MTSNSSISPLTATPRHHSGRACNPNTPSIYHLILSPPHAPVSEKVSTSITIPNRLGMHARPAMMFVDAAGNHDCKVTVAREDNPEERFDGKSIMQVMMLAATQGTTIIVEAEGNGAAAALEELKTLVEGGFQESD